MFRWKISCENHEYTRIQSHSTSLIMINIYVCTILCGCAACFRLCKKNATQYFLNGIIVQRTISNEWKQSESDV